LATIHEKVKEAKLPTPALIVVGKVVDLKPDLEWFAEKA
jgi:uroporphyrin-III C-methyltransferase